MQIICQCPACQARFKVDGKYAGKKARCPKCQQIAPVPLAPPEPEPTIAMPAPAPAPASRPVYGPPPIHSVPLPPSHMPGLRSGPALATAEPPPPPPEPETTVAFTPPATTNADFPALQVNAQPRVGQSKSGTKTLTTGKRPSKSLVPLAVAGSVAALLFVGGVVGGTVYFRNHAAAQVAKGGKGTATATALILDWPESERDQASLMIDGRREPFAKAGELRFARSPGKHRVSIQRRGFEPFETEVDLAKGATAHVAPQWQSPAVAAAGFSGGPAGSPSFTPAGLAGGQSGLPDVAAVNPLEFVAADFVGAVVVHPQRLLQSPEFEQLGLSQMLTQSAEQWIDPRIIREAVILMCDPAEGTPSLPAAVVRFTQPVSVQFLMNKLLDGTDTRNEGGLQIVVTPDGQWGGYQPNPTTVLVGPPALLPKMVAAASNRAISPLVSRLTATNLNQDLVAVLSVTGPMKALANTFVASLKTAPPGGDAPPADVLEAVDGLADKLTGATLTFDFSGVVPSQIVVSMADEDSASRLEKVARYALQTARDQVVSGSATDVLPDQFKGVAKGSAAEAFSNLELAVVGNQLVLSLPITRADAAGAPPAASATIVPPQPSPSSPPPAVPQPPPPPPAFSPPVAAEGDRTNNLRLLGAAFLRYHDTFASLPPAATLPKEQCDAKGRPLLSWRVHILPYIEQQQLYEQFHLNEPWDSPHNKTLLDKMPAIFRTTEDSTKTTLLTIYGKGAAFSDDQKGLNLGEITDATSSTLICFEAGPDKAVHWTKPEDAAFNPDDPKTALGMLPQGVLLALMADGRVLRLSGADLPPEVLRALVTRAGGEQLTPAQQ